MQVSIRIRHCNNIREADISIAKGALNIKYGPNGTGKTTIANAICFNAIDEHTIDELMPYSGVDEEGASPSIEAPQFNKVMVFNEEYSKRYLFQNENVFSDSYKVLLKTSEIDDLSNNIDDMLNKLKTNLMGTESINDIKMMMDNYTSTIKFQDGKIKDKKGAIGELLKGYGAGFDKHNELHIYRPFYQGRSLIKVSSWASWRSKGINQLLDSDPKCPFCAADYDSSEITIQNDSIKKVFKESALKIAEQIREFIDHWVSKGYINPEVLNRLEDCMGDASKSAELEAELNSLGTETDYLRNKLNKILDFSPTNVTHDQINNIEQTLQEMIIEKKYLDRYYNESRMNELIDYVNLEVNSLLDKTRDLKILFSKHISKLEKMIKIRSEDINEFFVLAGFPYKFIINKIGENEAETYLVPVEGDQKRVDKPDQHLSWGERNAFALIMFMFEAVSENADLIVLDDPVSSFDKDKKFAVIKRMFKNIHGGTVDVTFYNRTILMLTHDLQPILDYVRGGFMDGMPVKAWYIQNLMGIIQECEIVKTDLRNSVQMAKEIAMDSSVPLVARIVNLRRYRELTDDLYLESNEYEVVSNIIHGRERPIKITDENKIPMTDEEIHEGVSGINKYIIGMKYEEMIGNLSVDHLIEFISDNNQKQYYRILAFRLLFERVGSLLKAFKSEYPGAAKFLNETNHIENDYVFQLDPVKYFSIPSIYFDQINVFFGKHSKLIAEVSTSANTGIE